MSRWNEKMLPRSINSDLLTILHSHNKRHNKLPFYQKNLISYKKLTILFNDDNEDYFFAILVINKHHTIHDWT